MSLYVTEKLILYDSFFWCETSPKGTIFVEENKNNTKKP